MALIEVDKPAVLDWILQRGNDVDQRIFLTDLEGAPIDITGWAFLSESKEDYDQNAMDVTWNIEIVSSIGGEISLQFTSDQTASELPTSSVYNIFYTNSLGQQKKLCLGVINMEHSALEGV